MTAQDILETEIPNLLKQKPELDLTKSADWVSKGASGEPKMTITVSNEDFVKIRQKTLNAQMAAMQGKLKFKPMDMGLAMKLAKLLG
jgi:putative sterol carrier protein